MIYRYRPKKVEIMYIQDCREVVLLLILLRNDCFQSVMSSHNIIISIHVGNSLTALMLNIYVSYQFQL